jgi:uncharacterized membrane protein
MAPPERGSVEERLERLEMLVEDIRRRLPEPAREPEPLRHADDDPALRARPATASIHIDDSLFGAPPAGAAADGGPAFARAEGTERAPDDGPRRRTHPLAAEHEPAIRWDGQFWLNRLGIGIFLLGVAFLFRYSIDQGWVTPLVRTAFGAALGLALFAVGMRLDGSQRRFVPVLLGGAVANFYIVGFAAFYLYGLIAYVPAFTLMVAVTALAFFLSIRKGEYVLAMLGAIGGLGTPLLLGIERGTPAAFALYTCIVLAGPVALYLYRGWRSVLWVSLVGGWLLLLLYANVLHDGPGGAWDRWMIQSAAIFAWVAYGLLPIAREVARRGGALRFTGTAQDLAEDEAGEWSEASVLHWHALTMLPPLLVLLVAALVWEPSPRLWGVLAVGGAAAYGLAALVLSDRHPPLSAVLMLAASVLLPIGSVAALDSDALLLALAAEALGLYLLARERDSTALAGVAHILFAAAATWTLLRLPSGAVGADFRGSPLVDLAVIGTAVGMSMAMESRAEAGVYRLFAHVAFLGWLWRILSPLPGGEGYVTVAWGAYAVCILVYAMRARNERIERVAIWTLLVVVAKLFLVDLAALEAIWRILLFLGIGGVFLFLSYSLQTWWKPAPGPEHEGGK